MSYDASNTPVVIVGAGIAGLTAAYCLKQQGIPTIIIEAAGRVGGRMTSDTFDGHVVDRGAQFLSSEYPLIIGMLHDLGLARDLCETSQCSAIVRAGIPHTLRASRPFDALSPFGFYPFLRLAWNTLLLSHQQKGLSLSNFSEWAKFDTETVGTWSDREIDPLITEYLFEPMLQGFYFQTPEETSKALAVVLSTFGIRQAKTLSLRSGLGILPETLAQGQNLKLNTPVHGIEYFDGKVLLHTASETLMTDRAIVAVPAPVANKIIVPRLAAGIDEGMQTLLATPYSASINIACVTDEDFTLPSNLKNVYGLLIPRKERTAVAAVGIENNKNRGGDTAGHLLNIMLSHCATLEQINAHDNDIVAFAAQSVSDYLPTLPAHIKQSRVYRWPAAEPLSPVGRATTLYSYRQRCAQQMPSLLLAGDYMSMPFTEGAAESGYWAARMVTQASNNSFQLTAYGSR